MITLVTFYAPGCLLVLCECEWILEISTYFKNHHILCCFKLSSFSFDGCPPLRQVVHRHARHESPSNITPPFPESYRTLATYYRLLFLKGRAATFNYYAFFFHSGNCTVQKSYNIVNIFKSKCWNLKRKQEDWANVSDKFLKQVWPCCLCQRNVNGLWNFASKTCK